MDWPNQSDQPDYMPEAPTDIIPEAQTDFFPETQTDFFPEAQTDHSSMQPEFFSDQPQFFSPQRSPAFIPPYPQLFALNEFKNDAYFPNGKKKYDSFHKDLFFYNGNKAFDGFQNKAFYFDNKIKAFDGFHGNINYHNGKEAYDAFFKKAKSQYGSDLGNGSFSYSAQNVKIMSSENTCQFEIILGEGFRMFVAIKDTLGIRTNKIRLCDGYHCVLEKSL